MGGSCSCEGTLLTALKGTTKRKPTPLYIYIYIHICIYTYIYISIYYIYIFFFWGGGKDGFMKHEYSLTCSLRPWTLAFEDFLSTNHGRNFLSTCIAIGSLNGSQIISTHPRTPTLMCRGVSFGDSDPFGLLLKKKKRGTVDTTLFSGERRNFCSSFQATKKGYPLKKTDLWVWNQSSGL